MIQSKRKATNEYLGKNFGGHSKKRKILKFNQDQICEEIETVKKDIEKLDRNIKQVENDPLDSVKCY